MNWATLTTGLRASLINIKNNGLGLSAMQASLGILPLMPYNQLVDDNGNRVDYYRYEEDFVKEKEEQGYKNWKYNYLDELDNMDNTRKEQAVSLTIEYSGSGREGIGVGRIVHVRENERENQKSRERGYLRFT